MRSIRIFLISILALMSLGIAPSLAENAKVYKGVGWEVIDRTAADTCVKGKEIVDKISNEAISAGGGVLQANDKFFQAFKAHDMPVPKREMDVDGVIVFPGETAIAFFFVETDMSICYAVHFDSVEDMKKVLGGQPS